MKEQKDNLGCSLMSLLNIPLTTFIVFLTLKLTHTIDWHWLWVLSPLWITAGLVTILCAVVCIVAYCYSGGDD